MVKWCPVSEAILVSLGFGIVVCTIWKRPSVPRTTAAKHVALHRGKATTGCAVPTGSRRRSGVDTIRRSIPRGAVRGRKTREEYTHTPASSPTCIAWMAKNLTTGSPHMAVEVSPLGLGASVPPTRVPVLAAPPLLPPTSNEKSL